MHAAPDAGLSKVQTSKPWSLSASLRGFYDDNITTVPSAIAQESFGVEVAPAIGVNLLRDQTYLGLGYEYRMRWYEDRDPDSTDHSHRFNLDLTHDFSETFSLELGDQLSIAQEPEVIEPTGATRRRTVLRADSDNLHNRAHVNFTTQLSRVYSLLVGYSNDLYDYDDKGAGSFSALLDRLEHKVTANLRAQLKTTTTGLLGYQYRVVDYTSNDVLTPFKLAADPLNDPEIRNSDSHYVYVGVDHQFNPQLVGSIRAGAQFTQYNELPGGDDSTVSPYVDANIGYTYAEGSTASLGVRHERNQTDVAFLTAGDTAPILDQETTALYGSVAHQLTSKITGNLVALYAHSSFESGAASSSSDNFFSVGLNFGYQINQYLLAEAGYNFDDLDSDLGFRSYDRNRVYIGLKASY